MKAFGVRVANVSGGHVEYFICYFDGESASPRSARPGEVRLIADEAMTCGTDGFPIDRIVQGDAGLEMR